MGSHVCSIIFCINIIIMHCKTFSFLLFLLTLNLHVSARPHIPDLSVLKTFAPGESMMMFNYDGRERIHGEDRKIKAANRLPDKMGNIVDGQLVPFHFNNKN